ncbi:MULTISPECIES: ribonuclease R family protein [Gordonibacter]|uniref:Ribonuclease R n=1 Tax=Gordonibacter faecis TaxID=3047475 RepID=A0ABT7DI42_9ACTN|nr:MULTISPECIES: RNB domain-containing ribonuclease [unclassified Gordonibacter]MDJ1649191.1 RNB domain-containing ribonuclease [Gordonibacter sp. KGMB12511]HIW76173.1 RNB domain-containing ribonuclease [Candidatus Gordonibacter avicola]
MPRTRSHTRRRPRSNPRGVLSVRSGSFGFVETAEGGFFVPAAKMGGAFDGDLVEVAPLPPRGSGKQPHQGGSSDDQPAARVVRVLDRAHDSLVGRYEVAEPFGVVVPEDTRIPYDIFTMRADFPHVPDGALVRVRVTEFPTRNTAAMGIIEEVLGMADDARVSVDVIVARHKLETSFSDAALAEARAAELDETGALASEYRDLRERFTFTIDPADARDFDDAVSLEAISTCESATAAGDAQSLKQSCSHETSTGRFGSCGTRLVSTSDNSRSGLNSFSSEGEGSTSEYIPESVCVVDKRGMGAARWRLGVHIADVSHYVPWNSSLDLDARRRATSVYLVDRVIPMLPEELSGDLCSLKPGEVRRTITADLYLDERAQLVGYDLYPALIRSSARLSYDEAQKMIDSRSDTADLPGGAQSLRQSCSHGQSTGLSGSWGAAPRSEAEQVPEGETRFVDTSEQIGSKGGSELGKELSWRLKELSRIARARAAAREGAGGLDFDTVEARVRLDGEGHPVGIDLRRKTDATSLIEEAMILANETVAAHLRDAKFPSLFRVHEQPAADNLAALIPVFQEFPWFKDVDQNRFVAGDAQVLQKVLAASAGRPEGELVSSLLLRSMKRAVYRPVCEPHYGLASAAYTHFTSPIRRYPDLVVHRMLKAQLTKRSETYSQEVSSLPWIAEHSSDMERVAEKAARESQELKIIEYLEAFVGQRFSAVVSGVATYGLYVRLDNTAEGLVPVRYLGEEYFAFDAVQHRLTGQETGRSFRLGQRLAVVLTNADTRARRLDFRLANDEA